MVDVGSDELSYSEVLWEAEERARAVSESGGVFADREFDSYYSRMSEDAKYSFAREGFISRLNQLVAPGRRAPQEAESESEPAAKAGPPNRQVGRDPFPPFYLDLMREIEVFVGDKKKKSLLKLNHDEVLLLDGTLASKERRYRAQHAWTREADARMKAEHGAVTVEDLSKESLVKLDRLAFKGWRS